MSQNSYNQAIEIAKIILQTSPERLINASRNNVENARQVSLFIETLASDLQNIELQHINHD